MSAWTVLLLLMAGALISLALVAVGVMVAGHFEREAYKRYQQGLNDGWRARDLRGGIPAKKAGGR